MANNHGIGTLQLSDLGKGLITAVLTTLLTGAYALIESGSFTWVTFKPYVVASIGSGIAYILKNFLSNSEGKFLKKEGA